MPAGPGESLLTTLFADVHYYFSDPSAKPLHHRFSRGSYVYVYHNQTSNDGKLEIANHAGTPDQDAFSGYLHAAGATVQYSYKQPTLCAISVPSASPQDHGQWHIPTFNERNEQKYLYRIRSLDIYLWTEKDAATFLRVIRSVLPVDKVDIRDAPPEHRDSMSPVVQQLERTAISTQLPQRNGSTTSSHPGMPGPPTPATPGTTGSPVHVTTTTPVAAYNPAAPAAPEPIAHREKTPPPPDAATGIGLSTAAHYPHQSTFNPNQAFMPQSSSHNSSFAGPHQAATGVPPPPPGGPTPNRHGSLSFAGPPSSSSTPNPASPQPQPQIPQSQSFGPTPSQYTGYPQQTQSYQQAPSATPPYGIHTPLQSPGLPTPPPTQPGQHQSYHLHQQGPPSAVGGYTNYDYSATQQSQQQGYSQPGAYNVHSQAYRPTEAEAAHGHGHGKPTQAGAETKGSKVGKKVDGFLKRLDKMI